MTPPENPPVETVALRVTLAELNRIAYALGYLLGASKREGFSIDFVAEGRLKQKLETARDQFKT